MSGRPLPPAVPRWYCAQLGAREHYAIARALHQDGRLGTLYTDFWAGPIVRAVADRWTKGAIPSLAARHHKDLGGIWESKGGGRRAEINGKPAVHSWNLRALWWEGILREKQKAEAGSQESEIGDRKVERTNRYHGFIEVGRRFATCVREDLKRRPGLNADSIFFAYDTGALEALEWCRCRGIKSILNRIDPNRVEVQLVRAEEKQWPGWAPESVEVPEEYFVRREQEWALADRVLVNSEFCRQALLKQGVPPEKLVVVPLCYETGNRQPAAVPPAADLRPLKVLFLGQVILRKGIQYLMAAARLLERENIHFDVVGPVGISAEAVATAPPNLTFQGRAGRNEAAAWYQRSHVFVLPTLSDGFALTQLEAMAQGLPVIATPCCGAVVNNGTDGFIVPPRDAEALAGCLLRYLVEPELLRAQRKAALIKAGQFTLQRLAGNLTGVESALRK